MLLHHQLAAVHDPFSSYLTCFLVNISSRAIAIISFNRANLGRLKLQALLFQSVKNFFLSRFSWRSVQMSLERPSWLPGVRLPSSSPPSSASSSQRTTSASVNFSQPRRQACQQLMKAPPVPPPFINIKVTCVSLLVDSLAQCLALGRRVVTLQGYDMLSPDMRDRVLSSTPRCYSVHGPWPCLI